MNELEANRPMPDGTKCPQCGTPLPAGVLAGLCPACLLKQGAAADTAIQPATPPFVPPGVEEVAKLFPQLEILGLLGKGGMGAVYKARQPALDRLVALKILPAQAAPDAGFAERFTREARALARLSHPNIVAMFEFGQVGGSGADGSSASRASRPRNGSTTAGATPVPLPGSLHYFIMEFVDGVNLRQLEQAGRLSSREALQIVPQICDALQYAHDEGVVHRDIKPENVLVDRKGRVKIADFGLAKILGRSPLDLRLTREGQVMGTPHYMAPEQVEHPADVDHRADIFSLGVVFYELLTGELPLGKFQPPSRKVQMDVRLDDVVLHALEKEPDRRYQHAGEVKTAVETIARSAPPPAATPAGTGAARKPTVCRARALRVGIAVFVFVTLAASVVTFLLPKSYSSTARITVSRDTTDIAPMMDPRLMPTGFDPYFILTEFEVLRSEKILDKVIDTLRLNETWAKKYGVGGMLKTPETRALLKRQLDLRQTRNTSMIEITAYSDRAKEAADIANAMAEVYWEYWLQKSNQQAKSGISTLKEEFDKHEKKVREKQAEVDRLRSELGVPDLDTGAGANSSGTTDRAETFRRLESIRVELSARLSQEEAQLSKLKSLDPKEQAQSLPTALPVPDMRLNELLSQRNAAQQALAQKLKDYGSEHIEVLKIKATLETNDKQTAEAVAGILSGLETRVAQDRAGLSNVVMGVEAAEKTGSDKAERTRPYYVAKRELDELVAFRRVLQAKLASENIDVQLPKSPVDIVDQATPGLTPVRPNKPLNITLGAMAGLVLGLLTGSLTFVLCRQLGKPEST